MFEKIFKQECEPMLSNYENVNRWWNEIEKAYSGRKRFYHNLDHLDHTCSQLIEVKEFIQDWLMVIVALAYHDFVYNSLSKTNEEASADIAVRQLSAAGMAGQRVDRCRRHILATKLHNRSEDTDCNFFTDADLAILGADANAYQAYTAKVRKEYNHFPDFLYKPGRRIVLSHFLDSNRIYKTAHFESKFEEMARQNILAEWRSLS